MRGSLLVFLVLVHGAEGRGCGTFGGAMGGTTQMEQGMSCELKCPAPGTGRDVSLLLLFSSLVVLPQSSKILKFYFLLFLVSS